METLDDRLEPLYEALLADFEQHGAAAIVRLRETDVAAYFKVIAGLVTREVNVRDVDSREQEEPH